MTAPVMQYNKFWIVKPKAGTNQILNPSFAKPEGITGWSISDTGVTLSLTGDHQRRGAYAMQVNCAANTKCTPYTGAYLSVLQNFCYVLSMDVKAEVGQSMTLYIGNSSGTIKARKDWTATGYWQRMEVPWIATETATNYRAFITRNSSTSTAPFYVDGVQFENTGASSKATTYIEGYEPGCYWTGLPRQSSSVRSAFNGAGGELIDLSDYCKIINHIGLGHGDWNQIVTKMTSGGDMYQGSIRKSRQFSLIVEFLGNTQGAMEANRKAIIDALRPDLLEDQEMILRYQGFDVNGVEATNPIDIHCVPLPSMQDTPDNPFHQRAILSFLIPSGLLSGAYDEGKALDLYADFPAEHIVKRDSTGNWCTWTGSAYASLVTGLNGNVYDIKEAPNGDVYACGAFTNAGGVANADYIARWSKTNQTWEAVGAPSSGATIWDVYTMTFDAAGNLYVGGNFTNLAGIANADYFAKYTVSTDTWSAVGSGIDASVSTIAISPGGTIYIGGAFTTASGNTNCSCVAYWNGTAWAPLATGLNNTVVTFSFLPNGNLVIGGEFTNADSSSGTGDYICWWDGAAFKSFTSLGATEINNYVSAITTNNMGELIIGGQFTAAGDDPDANYLAIWHGNNWSAINSESINNFVKTIYCDKFTNDIYIGGSFTSIGDLTISDKIAVYSAGAWKGLDIDLPSTGYIGAIFIASDKSLYLGGSFSTVEQTPDENAKTGIVALNLNVTSASANTFPFMQIRGPGALKSIVNYSTNSDVQFSGLTLQAGEWINLSFDPVNLKFTGGWSGRGNVMRYVVAGSDYGNFYLKPGANYISLFMTDGDSNSGAFMIWTPQFWGLDGALL